MNISLFYNLRDRLRATALSGCDVIKEDFRLKRAVEEFEPLAGANKIFGKLYTMCNELFTSEKPAPLLADCIALCEALAVTQGTFKDSSETSEFIGVAGCEPSDIHYYELLREKKESKDPRVINWHLNKLKLDNNSNDFKEYVMKFFGRDLVPMLKTRVDLTNPKEKGKFVDYIGELAGADENEWYISLIDDENISSDVRASAVRNLGYSESNAERLLELYRTEKAKIKDASAFALIRLDVPEVEPVLQKITTGKFAKKNAELIAMSGNKIAVDFAIDYAYKAFEEFNKTASERKYDYDIAIEMLEKKSEAEDVLFYLSNKDKKFVRMYWIQSMLINNLAGNKDEKFRVLIENLYKRNPEYFGFAYLMLNVLENRGIKITDCSDIINEHRENFIRRFEYLKYDSEKNCYMLNNIRLDDGKIYDVLEVLADTSYIKKSVKLFTSKKAQEKDEQNRNANAERACEALEAIFKSACENDKDRIYKIMIDFCKLVMDSSPTQIAFEILLRNEQQYIRENPHLFEDLVMYVLKNNIIYSLVYREIPKDMFDTTLIPVYRKLKTLLKDKKYPSGNVSVQIKYFEIFLKENDYDISKI